MNMNSYIKFIITSIFIFTVFELKLFAIDCVESLSVAGHKNPVIVRPTYAKGFVIYQYADFKLVKTRGETLLLSKDINKFSKICEKVQKIKIPIKRLILFSTTYLPIVELLGEKRSLIAVRGTKYVNSKEVNKLINSKKIGNIGRDINIEEIISLNPDLVFSYQVSSIENQAINKLKEMKISIASNLDYLENSPLARVEWIKFIALFYNKSQIATVEFNKIRDRYEMLKKRVKRYLIKYKIKKVKVAVGSNFHGVWYAPGVESDLVHLISDAGGRYLWRDSGKKKRFSISMEKVMVDIEKSDYWFPQNGWNSINELINEDLRYKSFKVVKQNLVYNNNAIVNRAGGNDYWESGLFNIDLMLLDFVNIFYPKMNKNVNNSVYNLKWYKRLF